MGSRFFRRDKGIASRLPLRADRRTSLRWDTSDETQPRQIAFGTIDDHVDQEVEGAEVQLRRARGSRAPTFERHELPGVCSHQLRRLQRLETVHESYDFLELSDEFYEIEIIMDDSLAGPEAASMSPSGGPKAARSEATDYRAGVAQLGDDSGTGSDPFEA